MTKWEKINKPRKTAIEIRKKLESISDSYNTEDGQIRWLQDNDYEEFNLDRFYSEVISNETKTKMSEWRTISLKLSLAVDILKKLD